MSHHHKQAVDVQKFILEYQNPNKFQEYQTLTKELKTEIIGYLEENKIQHEIVTARTKSVDSLRSKLQRKPYRDDDKPYDSLNEIHDLSGIRIVVRHPDDIGEVIENVITEKFKIVYHENKRDKSVNKHEGCFGYRSEHYVVKRACGKHAEIQIRTLLQHSWARFSELVDYKREEDAPVKLRRELFLLAAMLEFADKQFVSLHKQYKEITIDLDKLNDFLSGRDSKLVEELIRQAEKAGFHIRRSIESERDLSMLVWGCNRAGIQKLSKLKETLNRYLGKESLYLAEIHEKIGVHWTADAAFLVELVLYKEYTKNFTEDDLVAQGWARRHAHALLKVADKPN